MRCLIVIALCFVLANATYKTKNRFHKMLNRYQNRYDQNDHQNDYNDNLFGSDDLDNHMSDYMDEIRREKLFDRDQCPRGMEDILGQDEWDETSDFEDETRGFEDIRQRGNWYSEDEEPQQKSHLIKEVEDANIKLATRLYKQSRDEKDDKNTVVSPLSVQLALAALNIGARGNTKLQIGRVIGGRLQKQERKQIFKTLIRHLKGGLRRTEYSTRQHTTKINPVTGIFVIQTTRAQQQFIQQVKTNLGATVKHCSFSHQPQQCRQIINKFVSQKTHHKINQIVPQDAITDNTKMILVNAMELKATWGPQMRRHVTKETKFYPLDSKKVKIVEVMETKGRFKYYEDELVKIVGIPTQEKELTLYVIVPKEKDGLTEVEKLHLHDSVELKKLLDQTDKHVRNIEVHLPKFQIKHKIDVRRTLRKQGVTDAFDPQRADFSGITGVPRYQDEEDTYEPERRFRRNPYEDMDTETRSRRNPFLDINTDYESERRFRRSPFEDVDTEYDTMGETTGHETKLHLNKFIHQSTIKITENGITATTGSQNEEYEQGRFGTWPGRGGQGTWENEYEGVESFDDITGFRGRETTGQKVVKANHAFAFVVKHNPTKQLVFVGRVIDAAQKKVNDVHQTINTVDQF